MPDYSQIDRDNLQAFVFYPQKTVSPCPIYAFDVAVPVLEDVSVACRYFQGDPSWPWILFFHGNGEVAGDYDELAPFYFRIRRNLVVADYRGYGASTGEPSFAGVIHDSHIIFKEVKRELHARQLNETLWIMGRSLGSMSALELASRYGDQIRGIIIESGFISVATIMRHLDVPINNTVYEQINRESVDMVRAVTVPVLIIHGENDLLVPYQEALDLFETIGSEEKELVTIPFGDHNTVMAVGFRQYFDAIERFTG